MISGAAALIYQVAWGRAFTPIFGGTTRSAAAIVSVVFLGMALGNWLGGRWALTRAVSLRRYAWAEFLIAVGALLVMGWLSLYQWGYPALYSWGVELPATIPAVQIVLGLVALGPPSVAMGATLPLMARAVTDNLGRAGSRVGAAYALNTLGATVGAALAGFVLPDLLGTRGSLALAMSLNIGVGVVAWRIALRGFSSDADPGPVASSVSGSRPNHEPGSIRAGQIAAALSGLTTLALEVFFIRMLVNQTDGSSFSFALILCIFLISLALGAALCALMVDRVENPWHIVSWAGCLAALGTFLAPLGFVVSQTILPDLARSFGYWFSIVAVSGLLMVPTVLASGMVLPALWRMASLDLREVGGQVGRLTAINTLAGVVGSLGAAFFLLPAIGIASGFGVLALMFSLLACVGIYQSNRGWSRVGSLAAVLGLSLWAFSAESWQLPMLSLGEAEEVVFYKEGEAGTVAVTRLPRGSLRLRVNDRYTLTSSLPESIRAQRSQARLALSFVEEPRSAAFIGVGGAISMSALSEFPGVERILAMELIPGVLEAAPRFGSANRNILEDARVEVVQADGRNHLYGRAERFDVIVGDVFSPWHAGTGYLFTAEHFDAVRRRLSEQGVFVQWLQADQFSPEEIRIVVATFLDVFPRGELWMTRNSGPVPLLGLVGQAEGFTERRPRLQAVHSRFLAPICTSDALKLWAASADRNTDDRPIVEYRAARTHLQAWRRKNSGVMKSLANVCGLSRKQGGKKDGT